MRVKICGITREEDATLALSLGADAVGVVFSSDSPRSVTVEQAQAIRGAVSGLGMMVGLFVNPSAEEVEAAPEEPGRTEQQAENAEAHAAEITILGKCTFFSEPDLPSKWKSLSGRARCPL